MGGCLQKKDRHNDNSTGLSVIDFPIPTLTLGGTKDGLFRITRNAEGYFHQVMNVRPDQKNKFPVMHLKGVSHGSFIDEDMLPTLVKNKDLKPGVSQARGYEMVGTAMTDFILYLRNPTYYERLFIAIAAIELKYFQPFIDGMNLEGSYNLKIPCYNKNLMNPDTPKECLAGSPWVTEAQVIMGGDTSDENVNLKTVDNFHRVYTTKPPHIPQMNNTCPEGAPKPCELDGVTVSQNIYSEIEALDTGFNPQAALEQKAKLMSRQQVQWHAGHTNASFDKLDKNDVRCEQINQKALDWALANADSDALELYNSVGNKLVIGPDLGPYNAGPLWIWIDLEFKGNDNKTQTTVRSPEMRTPIDYWENQV